MIAPPSLLPVWVHPLTIEKKGVGATTDASLDDHKERSNTWSKHNE